MDLQQAEELFQQAFEAHEKGEIDAAISLLIQIEKTSDELKNIYANAQLFLGILLEKQGNLRVASEAYKNVKREYSASYYAFAQLSLWDVKNDKQYLENILLSDDLEIYAEAQFILGNLEKDLDSKNNYWQQIPKESKQVKKENYQINIVKNIAELENPAYKNELFQVFRNVSKTLRSLFVDNYYEQSIAHYTTLNVSKLLLANKNQAKKPKAVFEPKSKLRLNTINLMNDPKEGLLINKLFCLEAWMNTQDLAFITCFTLHHDSLNQFRLYGKKDQQEASGLSCVLDKQFFSPEHNTLSMFRKNEDSPLKKLLGMTHEKCLDKMPLYRCIYLDPTSGLIKVAQREEWSFHREYKKEDKVSILEPNPEAEQHWKEYQNEILEIESRVSGHLKELVEQVKLLNPKDLSDEEKELLAEILLPLRYLIKHMAFKEEQECRIIYVTQMDNPLIQYDENLNRIYIDYEPSIMAHLEKIYLAPKAKDEKMLFEYLCSRGQEVRTGKSPVKVKISQNPFR